MMQTSTSLTISLSSAERRRSSVIWPEVCKKRPQELHYECTPRRPRLYTLGVQTSCSACSNIPVCIGQLQIEEVDSFVSLGSVVASDGDEERDVVSRIGKGFAGYQQLRPIWRTNTISLKIKLGIYNVIIIPTVTYACETWQQVLNVDSTFFTNAVFAASYEYHTTITWRMTLRCHI